MAIGRAFAVVALVTAGESAALSAFESPKPLLRDEAPKGVAVATFRPTLRLRFALPYQPGVALRGAALDRGATLREPSMLRLMVDPRFYRMDLDALGDAWLSPTWTHGALVGRLLLRF
ncbi:MAG TPA: hypothetical protein VHL80_00175 [Polyangia bacterium]|nr:hypothetical protein [Polyangia bacterium]